MADMKSLPRRNNHGDRNRRARALHWDAVRAIGDEQNAYSSSPELPSGEELDRLHRAKMRAIRLADLADAAAAAATVTSIGMVATAPVRVARRREHRAAATVKATVGPDDSDGPEPPRPNRRGGAIFGGAL
jgi:hypothetical protein